MLNGILFMLLVTTCVIAADTYLIQRIRGKHGEGLARDQAMVLFVALGVPITGSLLLAWVFVVRMTMQ